MSLNDWGRLFMLCGGWLVLLSSGAFLLPIGNGPRMSVWIVLDLLNRSSRQRKWLLGDLKNPDVKFGGLLGLLIRGFIAGTGLIVIGFILWATSHI